MLALAAAVAVVYAGSLTAPFVFDDMHTVVHNTYITQFGRAGELFTRPVITSVTTILPNMFRPLLMLSYAANYAAGGLHPAGYHLVNIWLHLLNALLLYVLLTRRLAQPPWVALGCALLFAVHPLNSQAVVHISSRSTLWATTWVLLGCLAYRLDGRARHASLLTALAYAGGLLTKEIAITLPALLLWWDGIERRNVGAAVKRLWPCAVLLIAYLGWRHHLFGAFGSPTLVRDWWLNLGVACRAVFLYIRLWLAPVGLCVARDVVVPSALGDVRWWLPMAGYAALALTAVVCAWRGRWRALALGLGWFLIALLPSHPIATLNLPAGENHAYLPGIGWLLMLGTLAAAPRIVRQRRGITIAVGVVCVMWAVLTMQRVAVWRDPLRLWEETARCAPRNAGVRMSIAQQYERLGDDARALADYQRALRLVRTTVEEAQVRTNLGAFYWRTGQLAEARAQLVRAIAADPQRVEAYNNLGLVEEDLQHVEEAARWYRQALQLAPDFPDPALHLEQLKRRRREMAP